MPKLTGYSFSRGNISWLFCQTNIGAFGFNKMVLGKSRNQNIYFVKFVVGFLIEFRHCLK